jgi:peptidoglycan hydrolase-like protein with peptidoglycan-binding domain
MPNLLKEMNEFGIDVYPVKGWETRGRPYTFAPVGVMIHHTAGKNSLRIITNGRKGLPGPLSQFLISKSGRVYLVSQGYCNHAGTGSSSVLNYTRKDIAPRGRAKSRGNINGNRHYWGIEVENLGNGSDPYTEAQIRSLEALSAFLCKRAGWTENRVIHHKEWTRRKIDMSYNGDVRKNVAAIMSGKLPKSVESKCEEQVFQVDDSGVCVERIQSLLKSKGANIVVDGQFGPNTKEAVEQFQLSRNITSDGIVGPATWAELDKSPKSTATTSEYTLLKYKITHADVEALRSILNKVGHLVDKRGRLFDSSVKLAVEKFQRENKLSVDGIVGKNTWATLIEVARRVPTSDDHEDRILKINDSGPAVNHLQKKMVSLGFEVAVDGQFGSDTNEAVMFAQRVFMISSDGIVGSQTWESFNKGYSVDSAAVYRGLGSQALAMILAKAKGIPALSYLDKKSVRSAILIGDAAKYASRYTNSTQIGGSLQNQVDKVYEQIS